MVPPVILLVLAALLVPGFALGQLPPPAQDDLPPILERTTTPYEILSPIGAGKKTIEEAREQLRREAKKVQAEALIGVRCEPGGLGRSGLTWYPKDAYCRGLAVRFKQALAANPLDPGASGSTNPAPKTIDSRDFARWLAEKPELQVVDVREDFELKKAKLKNFTHIPMAELPRRYREINPNKPVVVICHFGNRSAKAAEFLREKGFKDARNLTGGIDAYSVEADSSIPRY